VGDETVVEGLPGHRVEAEVGFVEECDLGPRGQADDDADGRLLTARELLDRRLQRQAELVDELLGEGLVPMREEQPCVGQRMFGIGILRILLTLAYEAHAAEYAGVLVGVLPEYLDFTAGGEVLGGQYRNKRRLAGAVASEQSVDRFLYDAEAVIVEGGCRLVCLGQVAELDD